MATARRRRHGRLAGGGGATASGRQAPRCKWLVLIDSLVELTSRIVAKRTTRAYSVKCAHTRVQNIAAAIIFACEIAIELERRTSGRSKRLKGRLSKHTRAATSELPKAGLLSLQTFNLSEEMSGNFKP